LKKYLYYSLIINHGRHSIFAHSQAIAFRGKFCSDKSAQNLNPQKYCVRLHPKFYFNLVKAVALISSSAVNVLISGNLSGI